MNNRITIQMVAEFIRSPETTTLDLPSTEVFDFEVERANRPPRFIEVVNDYRNGIPIAAIVNKYHCSRSTVLRYARLAGLSPRPKAFDSSRRDKVIELYKMNRPIAEIALAVGVSMAYVSTTAVAEGINRRDFQKGNKTNEE